ncbi:hypothetical protein [Malaciobacter marinus]|uniref:hypothetical protein n=1 Tax=Malaciobacter marinus TaxID=505249 RepID=UPI003AFF7808
MFIMGIISSILAAFIYDLIKKGFSYKIINKLKKQFGSNITQNVNMNNDIKKKEKNILIEEHLIYKDYDLGNYGILIISIATIFLLFILLLLIFEIRYYKIINILSCILIIYMLIFFIFLPFIIHCFSGYFPNKIKTFFETHIYKDKIVYKKDAILYSDIIDYYPQSTCLVIRLINQNEPIYIPLPTESNIITVLNKIEKYKKYEEKNND